MSKANSSEQSTSNLPRIINEIQKMLNDEGTVRDSSINRNSKSTNKIEMLKVEVPEL